MDQNKRIGSNIKLYRSNHDLTQESLAAYLGITRVEENYYENGKRNIPSSIMTKAAKLFGIEDYDLCEADKNIQVNVALTFRVEFLRPEDLNHIADFRKIVLNYLIMKPS